MASGKLFDSPGACLVDDCLPIIWDSAEIVHKKNRSRSASYDVKMNRFPALHHENATKFPLHLEKREIAGGEIFRNETESFS